ncbi:MAG TPA: metalloregulator ArsR/SmtB family transcription factor [bacterium]|jgi:rhodanese-related sulfurtransferase
MGELTRNYKNTLYKLFARIGRALSSPRRIEILEILNQGERTVEVIAHETGMSVANASQHLQILKNANVVDTSRDGLHVTYRIADSDVSDFVRSLRKVAVNHLAEVESLKDGYLAGKSGLHPITTEEGTSRLKRGKAVLLDVRPKEEYQAAHLPDAISIPLDELKKRHGELPKNKDIIAYCRGPFCLLAVQAVEILRHKGFKADWIEDGVLEWKEAGRKDESSKRKTLATK